MSKIPSIEAAPLSGVTPVAVLVRESDDYRWNPTAQAWQAAPTFDASKIAMIAGSGVEATRFKTGPITGLGSPEWVTFLVCDDAVDAILAQGRMYVLGGYEAPPLDAPSVRSAVGLATASLDTQLAALSSGIGAVSVMVTPLAVTVSAGEVSSQELVAYQFCGFSFLLTITDDNGSPINLSGKTISFVVHDLESPTNEVFELTTGSGVTVGGASHNQLTIAADSTRTQSSGTFRWFVKDITAATNAVPLGEGSFEIRETPADA